MQSSVQQALRSVIDIRKRILLKQGFDNLKSSYLSNEQIDEEEYSLNSILETDVRNFDLLK
jgi:hypothetical protein